jgi:putative ABC transport system ATP-binding protein
MSGPVMLRLQNVEKRYGSDGGYLALDAVSLELRRAEFCALVGPSGSGKSTLMNIIGLLDRPSSGSVFIEGEDATIVSPEQGARLRNKLIGFVFQAFHLLPRLSAWENAALPLLYRGVPREQRRALALACLARVGLGTKSESRPHELSGGQRQRIAIARALIGEPSLLLADEPTGSLDSVTAAEIMALFRDLNSELGLTVVMVTHDQGLARQCPRRVELLDGRIIFDSAAQAVSK